MKKIGMILVIGCLAMIFWGCGSLVKSNSGEVATAPSSTVVITSQSSGETTSTVVSAITNTPADAINSEPVSTQIITGPSITILSPNGGEVVGTGSAVEIRWTVGKPGIARIDLLNADGTYCQTIYGQKVFGDQVPNTTGSWFWTTGDKGLFKLRIYEYVPDKVDNAGKFDETDNPFSIVSSPLVATRNYAIGNQYALLGTANVKIGSYVLSASMNQDVVISSMTLEMTGLFPRLQNMRVAVSGVQFGETFSEVIGHTPIIFIGSSFIVAGSSVVVDVYADIPVDGEIGVTIQTTMVCLGVKMPLGENVGCFPVGVSGQLLSTCNDNEENINKLLKQISDLQSQLKGTT